MRDHKSIPDDDNPEDKLDEFELPPWPTLSEFSTETEANDGVQIDSLTPGTKVRVQTKNSEYWLTVLEGGRRHVLVQRAKDSDHARDAEPKVGVPVIPVQRWRPPRQRRQVNIANRREHALDDRPRQRGFGLERP